MHFPFLAFDPIIEVGSHGRFPQSRTAWEQRFESINFVHP